MTAAAPLTIRTGAVVALRLFDVAYAIDLVAAEALWQAGTRGASTRSKLSATPAKAVAFDVPPVLLTLDPVTLTVDGVSAPVGVTARLYDFGVVVLALRLPVTDIDWPRFGTLVNAVDRAVGPDAPRAVWMGILEPLLALLAPAVKRPTANMLEEDYLLGIVQQWSEAVPTATLDERVDLVPLLSGERRALSDSARRDLLRQRFSYYTDDLVVLTWDRAFIVEPRGDSDVADVLEVANAQLLEMRYYDELLDDELPRMYDHVEETRRTGAWRAPQRFGALARRLYALVAEVTELTEKVDNALQVTEDVYLARIYASALDLLRVPRLSAAVDRKLSIIRDTYAALYDEASVRRGELLEIIIVVLIMIEIVMALIKGPG